MPVFFAPTFLSLGDKWSQWTEGLSHGYLLIAIFSYLFYKALPFNPQATQGQRYLAALCLVLSAGLWAVFALLDINLLAEFALIACLAFAVAFLFGFATAWHQRFLLLMPVFAITLWEHFNGLLVTLSGLVVGEMVRLIGIPAVIDGSSIFIPFGHIVIADGCSGLRYFIIALAMGYLISYLNGYKERGFIAIMAVAALLALISNWLRIFILILVGYFTEMQSSLMQEHDMFGWLLFGAVCLPAMYMAPVAKRQPPASAAQAPQPHYALYSAALLLLATGPAIYWLSPSPTHNAALEPVVPVNFIPVADVPAHLAPSKIAEPASRQFLYQATHGVYISISTNQRTAKGQKLTPYLGSLNDTEVWEISGTQAPEALPAAGSAFILRQKGGQSKIAQLQWLQVGEFATASHTKAKLLQLPSTLLGQNYFAVITLRMRCSQANCTNALGTLTQHANELAITLKGTQWN
ncbi:exosortase [Simiduia sp. 21SJ11W-1]|uniref:exosortase n=1 Tax=Simiduia sp. 21SJ11W-1 TaxID=2909669 RepID=UPI0020A1E65C|nr:exosortase [Simiduia sp. 21SJ11W-1]UTA47359.1 exosortase [Simiduia sp. 21SJ11W-1]